MILDYTIQVILFQLVFLLVFEIFLKKETYYNYNRFYLLLTPLIALVLPLLKLDFLAETVPQQLRMDLPGIVLGNFDHPVQNLPEITLHAENNQINWWLLTYFGGFGVSFVLFLRKYTKLSQMFRFRKVNEEKDFRMIEVPNSNMAFTFLNNIFLGDQLSEDERKHILSHELVHVKQKHSLDLIFFEVLKIILWFNPLIYVYQARIAGLHEFIADEEVVKNTGKKTYYEQLLNTAFNTRDISFTNQFFKHSLIKKRIIMLQKNRSSKLSKFKFLLVIPLMLSMVTYVACSEDNLSQNDSQASDVDQQMEQLLEALKEKENLSETEKAIYMNLLKRKEEGSLSSSEKETNAQKGLEKYGDKIPFAVIEKVPAFEGCAGLDGENRKACTSREISNFVNKNFDTSLGKKLGLTGMNRVIVQFRIDETGKITDVKARAPHPELEEEAKRVISSIPDMTPGEQNGQPISVMYSLPIAFQVSE
ncbi:hypothetical protein GCM10023115_30500 [Pontixanthobacter gangjinensis]|uniref:M56 family metallopeptidase n=1 Tax=Christiangramia aestuarii TaxID=1028746 RepID=UPI0031EE5EDF